MRIRNLSHAYAVATQDSRLHFSRLLCGLELVTPETAEAGNES